MSAFTEPLAQLREALRTVDFMCSRHCIEHEDALAALDRIERLVTYMEDDLHEAARGLAFLDEQLRATETERAALQRLAEEMETALERTLYIADHLFEMVPQSVWRDAGGDDWQGHYEGDYHAEQTRGELASYRAVLSAREEGAA